MLAVVADACQFNEDRSSGIVVLESDLREFNMAIDELLSSAARQKAIGHAASCGVPDPRINGMSSSAYPINSEGYSLDQVRDKKGNPLPPAHPLLQPVRYRVDIPVTRRLV